MQLYLDSADVNEIKQAVDWGVISGVTTNPSLLAKTGGDAKAVLSEICELVTGPVSVECISTETDAMVKEARRIVKLAPEGRDNIVVKIPMMPAGIAAVKVLASEGIKTNVTLVFSSNQAMLAASAGATYVSPFVGRLDDIGHDGMELIRELVEIFSLAGYDTEIIAASIRHPGHVAAAASLGAHISTVPFSVLKAMYSHPLTDLGIEKFLVDWEKLTGSRKPII